MDLRGKQAHKTASSQSHSSVDDFLFDFHLSPCFCCPPISLWPRKVTQSSGMINRVDNGDDEVSAQNKRQTLQSMNQKTAERSSRMNEFDNKLLRAHNLHNQTGPREEIFVYFHHRS